MTEPPHTGPANRQPNLDAAPLSLRFCAILVLTGIGTGLTSGLLMKLLRLVQHTSFLYTSGDFLAGVRATSAHHRLVVVTLAGLLGGIALYLLKRAAPNASTGVNAALWHPDQPLDPAPTLIQSLISILMVGMGAAIGREAALKDTGAVLAQKLSSWASLTPEQTRLLIACGAGAGMAAAYNVPLGGALFVLEVLLGTVSVTAVLAALITSFLAVAVSWLMLPDTPAFDVAPLQLSRSLLLFAALAGPLLGIASAFYVRVIGWAEKGKPTGLLRILAPVCVFAALGLLSIPFPEVLGNGKNVVQEAFGSQLGLGLLLWLLVLRPLATTLCLRSGAPGGLFTPTMTFGALLGGVLGEAFSHLAPASPKDSYAILGSGAMLASASQGPISSAVFMLELTNHTGTLIVPLLIAIAGATLSARLLETHSIYSIRN